MPTGGKGRGQRTTRRPAMSFPQLRKKLAQARQQRPPRLPPAGGK